MVNTSTRAFDGSIDARNAADGAAHGRGYRLRLRDLEATPEWTPIDLP